jgi:peptidoglycan/LPS O-acetylase OafA/YrhL
LVFSFGNIAVSPIFFSFDRIDGVVRCRPFFRAFRFLIGGILIDKRSANNYFKVFYIRRFYRIIPLYLLVLAVSLFVYYSHIAQPTLETRNWLFGEVLPFYVYPIFVQNFGWQAILRWVRE